ncbi:tRNA 5-methylaminomethyl-2-thiouridine biosynthesis bifunctional protein MnmC [Ferrigenium kumadai]|uniref:tRNA 5-methylaminomethyl-2-thiouridine biosynthesis bifunctional protein MnmC n=1 Tax=Ferrigenium kumadai TaxID=1682490 RepID=A0AAN1SXQ3_9PROT|nr:bifunctional tRNA (5-methylaminomethyl-2-thiouridine)(34)-methyltransferase MnmD/FAD-dependent 5-carboxymethylaminomethyl-2-thiouridine(34) oxidoreductase MnmC [Ferrigenium kumadai]BBI98572.1 tRNA 5-methylaminomethyl-2-thiouridine biosynthesis bifunctional protein MnmC [Ferrigenium kumadai]
MTLAWQDGLPFSSHFGDVYFSADSGLEETNHVFLQGNNLAERFAALRDGESFTIGETGFGTGLNFLCAWQLFEQVAPSGTSLDFFSFEKFPLDDDELRAALGLWPQMKPFADTLLARWRRRVPGWNRWSFGRVRLTLAIGDVAEVLPQLKDGEVDAWFLDGFSPAKNPEMWSGPVLAQLERASRAGATLATYTSAGWVRRGLQQAGFEVERVPGFGRKREMVCGRIACSSSEEARGRAPQSAIVIGGGIAGCAAAHALAQRGVQVTLLERAPQLASAASGNPRGILHARFGAGMSELHRFVLASYGHALALFDEALPADGELRAECGLLQLACNEAEQKRIAKLSGLEWPAHLLRFVNAAEASQLAGVEMAHGGLWFPGAGWVVPPALCSHLADDARIERRFDHAVETLAQTDAGWRVAGAGWAVEAAAVVVCCAHSALALDQFAHFPLTPVRGQVSLLPKTASSSSLHAVVCGDGYCAPAVEGVHVTGATHAFNDESLELRAADHTDNLVKLESFAPALREALGEVDVGSLGGRASVRCSAPGAMPLVGEVQRGLYCSLAHGTRGLLTGGLAGEAIAAMACGQLSPLPMAVESALAPLPRVTRTS